MVFSRPTFWFENLALRLINVVFQARYERNYDYRVKIIVTVIIIVTDQIEQSENKIIKQSG